LDCSSEMTFEYERSLELDTFKAYLMFFASWKALYVEIASKLLTRTENEPFANYLDKDDEAMACKHTLAAVMNCVALMASSVSRSTKIIHHFRVDLRTPLDTSRSNEAWALIGNGTTAFLVELSSGFWQGCEGVTPTFEHMCAVTNRAEFKALTVATTEELQDDNSLKFKGKLMVVLPPFLAKALMDTDTEDAVMLMMAACKALCQFDTMADGVFTLNGTKPEEGLLTAKEESFHVVQFLFLVGRNTLKGCPINVLTMARAEAWATSVATDCGVGITMPQEPKLAFILQQQLRGYANCDASTKPQKALTPRIIRELGRVTTTETDVAAGQLAKGAFFFAMQSCEYVKTYGECRMKLLELQNLWFFKDHREVPLDSPDLHLADSITIMFFFQKNDERDVTVTQH